MTRSKPMGGSRGFEVAHDLDEAEATVSTRELRGEILQPDTFMPSQHFDRLRGQASPEKRLLIAMVTDAVECFQKHSLRGPRHGRREGYEAELWLMSSDRAWPFSFENVCEILDIEADSFRTELHAWRRRQREGPRRGATGESGEHAA